MIVQRGGIAGLTDVVVGSFLDANPGATEDDFTILIRWGDGVTSNGRAKFVSTTGAGTTFNVVGTHTTGSGSRSIPST